MEKIYENIAIHWQQFDFQIAVLIFISYIVIDALFAKYTYAITSLNEYRSATIGSAIYLLLAFGVISYTENYLYIFPLALGSWIGTFYSVRKEKQRKAWRGKLNRVKQSLFRIKRKN